MGTNYDIQYYYGKGLYIVLKYHNVPIKTIWYLIYNVIWLWLYHNAIVQIYIYVYCAKTQVGIFFDPSSLFPHGDHGQPSSALDGKSRGSDAWRLRPRSSWADPDERSMWDSYAKVMVEWWSTFSFICFIVTYIHVLFSSSTMMAFVN